MVHKVYELSEVVYCLCVLRLYDPANDVVYCRLCVLRLYDPANDVDFTSWFIMCCPIMFINLILCWLSLVFLFIGPRYITTN